MGVATPAGPHPTPPAAGVTLARPGVTIAPGLAYAAAAVCGLLSLTSPMVGARGDWDGAVLGFAMFAGLTWFFVSAGRRARQVPAGRLELAMGVLRLRSPYDLTRPLEIPLHEVAEVQVGDGVATRGARTVRAQDGAAPNLLVRLREPRRLPLRGSVARLWAFQAIAMRVADPAAAEILLDRAVPVTGPEARTPMPPRRVAVLVACSGLASAGAALVAAWGEQLVSSRLAGLGLLSIAGAGFLWHRSTAARRMSD